MSETIPPLNPFYRIPILVLDGTEVKVVKIPLLSQEGFEFLKRQLDMYEKAIVYPRPRDVDPVNERAD